MKIDAHQHYWQPLRGDYDWMPKDDPILSRPYAPAELTPQLNQVGIDGTIVVQAAASVEESEYMLGLADASETILGVVGWINFEQPSHLHHLRRLARHPKFLGVRPMIQDIPDIQWMLRDDVQWAYRAICDLNLTFDALGFPEHIPNFLTLMQRYPEMRVVYDHCMKPQICDQMAGEDAYSAWADGMSRLANETSGVCKFSGLVTETASGWTIEDLRPFAAHVIKTFGADRLMWGSDWPVCRLKSEYADWHAIAQTLSNDMSPSERDAIFGGTAAAFYDLRQRS